MQEHLSTFTYHSVHVCTCVHGDACNTQVHSRDQINYVFALLINERTTLQLFLLIFIHLYKLYDEEHEGDI